MSIKNAIPRLEFDAVDAQVRELLKPTVDRLGYFGEFFQVAAHIPGAIPAFVQYTGAVKAKLSDAQNEVLALSVCAMLEADYERIQQLREIGDTMAQGATLMTNTSVTSRVLGSAWVGQVEHLHLLPE